MKTIRLAQAGVEADLNIDGAAPAIPADLRAVILSRSAAGERFVDLRPNTDAPPMLSDGDVIPADRVTVPPPVENVLISLDQLVGSVPLDDLRTTVSELGAGFNGLGPTLQLLLDSTAALTATATENLPQTLQLIRDARTVLQTQNELADPVKAFSRDLRTVSEQLRRSDPDIRRLTETGQAAGAEVGALLDESGDDLGRTIRELLITGRIVGDHLDGIEQVLVTYPMFTSMVPTLVPGDTRARLGLVLNVNDPPACSKGYEDTVARPGLDTTPNKTNFRAFCREPLFEPIGVRSAKKNYPFEDGKPRRPAEWFEEFYDGGPQDGINGHDSRDSRDVRDDRSDPGSPARSAPNLPGLLSAPGQRGTFGLAAVPLTR